MIYAVFGKELSIVNKKIEDLIHQINIDNIIKYDFSDSSLNDILDEVSYVDLFNEKKLILVNNFSFKKIKDKDEENLIRYINNMNDNVIIFKCIDEIDKRKSLYKVLNEKCKIIECKKMDYKELHKYVSDIFKENNKIIDYDCIREILNLCDYNTDFTLSEVNKLLLYTRDDDYIDMDIIDKVVSKNYEKETFNLIDNVLSKNIAGSLESYKILKNSGISSVIILDSIAKQYRLLFQMKILLKNYRLDDLSGMLGVNPYTLKKLFAYTSTYKEEEIIDKLYKLSDMDINIKMLGYDENNILESFFISL